MKHLSWNYPVVCMTPREDFIRIGKDIAGGEIISAKGRGFFDIARKIRGKVVHAHGRGFPFPELACFFAKRAIYTPHNDTLGSKWWTRAVRRFIFNRYDRIVVQTEYGRQNLIASGVIPKKIEVIPGPIDYKFFSKPHGGARFRKKFGLEKGEPFVLAIGIRPVKNPQVIIEACRIANVKAVLVGPHTKQELEKTWGGKGFEWYLPKSIEGAKDVIFTGQLSAKDALAAMDAATIFVNSSDYECYGMAAYESAAAGLPLCLPRLGTFDVFRDGALFHNPKDARELAENIRRYLNDTRLRKRKGAVAKRVAARFDYDKVKKRFQRFYKDFQANAV